MNGRLEAGWSKEDIISHVAETLGSVVKHQEDAQAKGLMFQYITRLIANYAGVELKVLEVSGGQAQVH